MFSKTVLYAFLFLSSFSLFAQQAAIEIKILVSEDVGSSKMLICGLDPAATDSLDSDLGEGELPPFPPAGVFEARFIGQDIGLAKLGEGTYKDFRQGDSTFADTATHEIKYQVGSGASIIIRWNLPPGITGHLSDLFGGVVVSKDMTGADSLLVLNPGALNKLIMQIYYTAIPSPPQLVSPAHESVNISFDALLVWQKVKDAATYNIQLATQIDFTEMVLSDSGITDTTYHLSNLRADQEYYWRVQAQNDRGKSRWSEIWQFRTQPETSAKRSKDSMPGDYLLLQNFPNPFNSYTKIEYRLRRTGPIQLTIYDISGRNVRMLYNGRQTIGEHFAFWDGLSDKGEQVTSGAYFVQLAADKFTQTRKILLLR